MLKKSKTNNIGIYVFVVIVGMVMVFPLTSIRSDDHLEAAQEVIDGLLA